MLVNDVVVSDDLNTYNLDVEESGYWTDEDKEDFSDSHEELTWDADDFWEEEILTPEEQLESDKAQARLRHEEAIGEMYASQFAFD
jgi:hypothetical protein